MAKLSNLKPRLGNLPPRVGYATGDEKGRDQQRRHLQPSKQWLKTAWWQKTRQRILLRDLYTCQMCKRLVAGKGEAHIDHIRPHRENMERFFCADDGLQTLCVPCHVGKKQREEQTDIKGVWY